MKLYILYGCDDAYAPYTGISITSLFENNPNDDITVYLAGLDISEENKERFETLSRQYGHPIVFLDTKRAREQIIDMKCGTWNGSLAAWLRFFVLDQIPEHVDTLIWLDSDTIIDEKFAAIISGNHQNMALSAVCDCLSIRERYRLGLKETDPYYNSGVIVFHLPYWRKNDVIRRMMENLKDHVDQYLIPDQDMMNDFFRGCIQRLPPAFNVQGFLFAYTLRDYYSVYNWNTNAYYAPKDLKQALDRPIITHFFRFLGDYPWTRGNNYHPCKALYEEWREKSPWKDHPGAPPRKELSFQAEKFLYRILPRNVFLRFFTWYTNRHLPKAPQ